MYTILHKIINVKVWHIITQRKKFWNRLEQNTQQSPIEQTVDRENANFLIWIQLEFIYFFTYWLLPTFINTCLGNSLIAYASFRASVSSRNSAHKRTEVSQNVQKQQRIWCNIIVLLEIKGCNTSQLRTLLLRTSGRKTKQNQKHTHTQKILADI